MLGLYSQAQSNNGPIIDDVAGVDFVGTSIVNVWPPVAYGSGVVFTNNEMAGMILYAEDPENNPLTYFIQDAPANGTLAKSN